MKKHFSFFRCSLCLMTFVIIVAANAQSPSGIHLIKKTVIGGEGGWDYLHVDAQNRRLYVSHATQVEVLDIDSHKKLGIIPNTSGIHGIFTIPKLNKGFTTNGKTNTATVFDLKTLKTIAEIPTGKKPDALLYDGFSGHIFIFNNDGNTATVVDVTTNNVAGTIELGGAPEAGVTNNKGLIYVNLEDTHEVVSFDAKTFVIKNRFKLAPGKEPTGLALDVETNRLFSVCGNELMIVLDADNGNVVAQLTIGKHCDGVVFDPSKKIAISSNGEGTLTLVQEISSHEFKILETVKTEAGARTIAIDSKTHHVFLSTANYGETPAATTENPRPRPSIIPGTFSVLEYGRD